MAAGLVRGHGPGLRSLKRTEVEPAAEPVIASDARAA